jgi:hypothetical protein
MPLINGKFEPLDLPAKHFKVLFDNSKKWRFRALWGGRNGAKDWTSTAACIEIAVRQRKRFLFTREVQKTLSKSSIQLISDQIKRMGYSAYFKIGREEISCITTGSVFWFSGLNDINVDDLKSTESVDYAVIVEAENLTKTSFLSFDETMRKIDCEIWFIFNPANEDDFIYQFCVIDPPEDLIGCNVNGYALADDGKTVTRADNPHVTDVMIRRAQWEFNTDREAFNNHCLGIPKGGGGRVYGIYNKDVHYIDFDRRYLSQCDCYMSIDPHRKYYPAIGWHAITPSGCVVTYNEWPKRKDFLGDDSDEKSKGLWYDEARDTKVFDMSMKELAAVILSNDLTIQYGAVIRGRTGDPRFFAENPDFTRELTRYGVQGWADAPFENIETQRDNMRTLFSYNTDLPAVGINAPEWYIARECENHDRCMRRHHYHPDKDKEAEDFKDFIDQMRYFLSIHDGRPKYIERKMSTGSSGLISLTQSMLSKK